MPTYKSEEKFKTYFWPDCPEKLDIFVHDIGHHAPPVGHVFGPAVREFYLIHIVVSGKGWFSHRGQTMQLKAGDCFVIRPMEVTTYGVDDSDPWEYFWVSFSGESAAGLADYVLPAGMDVVHCEPGVLESVKSMFRAVEDDESIGTLDIVSKLYAFLSELKKSASPDQNKKVDIVGYAVRYLENNYFRKINISVLASELGLTRAHFTSIFTKKTGQSPYDYLLSVRMERAAQLLTNMSLSVSEVAYSVGFSGIERFSEIFKKRYGDSPSAYRRKFSPPTFANRP